MCQLFQAVLGLVHLAHLVLVTRGHGNHGTGMADLLYRGIRKAHQDRHGIRRTVGDITLVALHGFGVRSENESNYIMHLIKFFF